jgi:hypothetical protein
MTDLFSTITVPKPCGRFCAAPWMVSPELLFDIHWPIRPAGSAQLIHISKLKKIKEINIKFSFIHKRFLI